MACIDCIDNCGDVTVTDKCVKYTGPDIPLFGICTGDSLYQVEAKLIEALENLTDGSNITLSDIDLNCQFLITFFDNRPLTLENLIQVLLDRICYQDANITALNEIVLAPLTINAPCLTLPTNPTRDQVLQAVATAVCNINTTVNNISTDYVKDSELCAKVNACISAPSQFNSRMVPFIAYPYHGPISNFDAAGIGLPANGFQKIYICNGQVIGTFQTPDYRGRSPIGSNVMIPGGPLDSAVDPSLPANAGYNITVGVKRGAFTDTLSVSQLPAHNHPVTDPGHTHTTGFGSDCFSGNNFCNVAKLDATSNNKTSNSSTTGITVGSTGNNQPHNTTHPSMGCNFIMYIP